MSSKSPSQIEPGTIVTIVGSVSDLTSCGFDVASANRIIGQQAEVVKLTCSGRYQINVLGGLSGLSGLFVNPESLGIVKDDGPSEAPEPEIEEAVVNSIRARRDAGREKYKTTMERKDLTFIQWLQHLQEELLDAAIYVEKLKREGGAK